ncbi:MAG: hypothetical protein CVU11_08475 [Bacteroidetes bacterium HGW-Bacteroidetes-6]|jgi:diguanylate cyclase (GGDEF)-like protein|nr:MAG: hypothetical protein CVU11_08475 [Bacteroidetes bacterium HGW-Bacteroidetes-6]
MLILQLSPLIIAIIVVCFVACIGFVIFRFRKVKKVLHTDCISGLPNYHAFSKHISKGKNTTSRIFLIDLNNFRRFNKIGYNTGDFVLKLFADRMQSSLKGIARCYRYRLGDEFIVIATLLQADLVERKIQKLNNQTIGCNAEGISDNEYLVFSYGKASFSGQLVEAVDAIKIAHTMLREQKELK